MSKRFNWGTKILGLVAVASLSLGLATPARAAIVNGGFEDFPDFNGWVTVGNTTIQGTDFHATVEGSLQALLSTTGTGGGTPLNAAALETFVGLSAGQLSTAHNATNGSAICQMFTATEGQTLTVHFDFLTNEPKLIIREELLAGAAVTSNNDFGFLTLKKDSDATSLQILADTNSTMVPTNPLDGANSFALRETNYLTYSTTLSAGTYKLCLGVANAGDTLNASGLLADAISVTGGSTVPLPAAVLVAPLGIAVAGVFGKRLRRAQIA